MFKMIARASAASAAAAAIALALAYYFTRSFTQRLRRIQELMKTGALDPSLRWRPVAVGV